MKAQYQVVAKNRMEAFYHPSIPRLGSIKGGARVVGLSGGPVPSYPKWWLIQVQRESIRIGWRLIHPGRFKRIKKLAAAQKSESK